MIEVIYSLIAIALIIVYGVACCILGYKIRQEEEEA